MCQILKFQDSMFSLGLLDQCFILSIKIGREIIIVFLYIIRNNFRGSSILQDKRQENEL